uniref:Uncharacterized protein n=1 Tax=Acrobeloides nanus TaxID=290746 RepID=A0A914DU03_9BILA
MAQQKRGSYIKATNPPVLVPPILRLQRGPGSTAAPISRNKGPPNNLDYDQAIISALDRVENADRHGKPMSQIIREKTFDM